MQKNLTRKTMQFSHHRNKCGVGHARVKEGEKFLNSSQTHNKNDYKLNKIDHPLLTQLANSTL